MTKDEIAGRITAQLNKADNEINEDDMDRQWILENLIESLRDLVKEIEK